MKLNFKKSLHKLMVTALAVGSIFQPLATVANADEVRLGEPKVLKLAHGYGGDVQFDGSADNEKEVRAGEQVTLQTATTYKDNGEVKDSGYQLYNLHVVSESGKVITGKISEDKKTVTFTMPNEASTVYPTFVDRDINTSPVAWAHAKNIQYYVSKDVQIMPDRPMGYEVGSDVTLAITKPKNYVFDSLAITDESGKSLEQSLVTHDAEHATVTVKNIQSKITVEWTGHYIGSDELAKNDEVANKVSADLETYDAAKVFTRENLDASKIQSVGAAKPIAGFNVKRTYFNRDFVKANDTLTSVIERDSKAADNAERALLGQSESLVAVYDVDSNSDYVVAHVNGLDKDAVFQAVFAENNTQGHVVNDITIDANTGIVYIPRSYFSEKYMNKAGIEAIAPMQVQLAIKQDKNARLQKAVTVTVDKTLTSSKVAAQYVSTSFATKTVNVNLGDEAYLNKLSSNDFVVYDNGVPLSPAAIRYNNETHQLEVKAGVEGQLDVYIAKDRNVLFGAIQTKGEARIKDAAANLSEEEINRLMIEGVSKVKNYERRSTPTSEASSNEWSNWQYTTEKLILHSTELPKENTWFTMNLTTGYNKNRASIRDDINAGNTVIADSPTASEEDGRQLGNWIVNAAGEVPSTLIYWQRGSGDQLAGLTEENGANAPHRWVKLTVGSQSENTSEGPDKVKFSFEGQEQWLLLSCVHVEIENASGGGNINTDSNWVGQERKVDFRIDKFKDNGDGTGWAYVGVYTPTMSTQSGIGLIMLKVTYDKPKASVPEAFIKVTKEFADAKDTEELSATFQVTSKDIEGWSEKVTVRTKEGKVSADPLKVTLPNGKESIEVTITEVETSQGYSIAAPKTVTVTSQNTAEVPLEISITNVRQPEDPEPNTPPKPEDPPKPNEPPKPADPTSSIGTVATDPRTGDHVAAQDKQLRINDVVKYRNLEPNKEYTVQGKLMLKSTGKPLQVNGKDVEASTKFTPKDRNGEVTVEFTAELTDDVMKALENDSVVAFEKVLGPDLQVVATHEDIEDPGQTVRFVKVNTTAKSKTTDSQVLSLKPDVVVDAVEYKNLIPGKEYRISATLMDKGTNQPITKDGQVVTVEKTFTPTEPNGTIDVEFPEIDVTPGSTVVAFEKIYMGATLVGRHEDIDSPEQSVYKPEIGTQAKDKETGKQEVVVNGQRVLTDTVRYTNLIPGREYTVEGSFVRKSDPTKVVATAKTTFKAEAANGEVTLEFTVNTDEYAGEDLVAFETLYIKKLNSEDVVEVANHKDPSSKSQTVSIKPKQPLPSTGTVAGTAFAVVGLGALIGALVLVLRAKKQHD